MMAPLPFDKTGDVLAQGGAVTAADVAVSTPWPTEPRAGRVGVEHTHEAQADLAAAAALGATNAKLSIDGVTYSITRAHPHEFLPHVDLRLKRVKGG